MADQRDHQREAPVDRVDEVVGRRRAAADAHVGAAGVGGVAHAGERLAAASEPPSDTGIASTSAVPPRRHSSGATAPWTPSTSATAAATFAGSVPPSIRISCGASAPSPIPERSSASSPVFALPDFAIVEASDSPSRRSSAALASATMTSRPDPGRQPAPARDRRRPARPRAAGLVVGAPVRPVEPRAERREHHRQQRDRDERRDQRDQHAAVAHRAQKRQRQRDQREQADRDGDAAEHDGAARRLHRPLHGLVAAVAVGALLAPARDHEQRVVDRHAQADQRDQELHDRRHRGQLGEPEQQHERGHDRHDRHHDRHHRQERGEDEQQHHERADPADDRLDEHAGALGAAALALQRVEARDVDRRAGDGRAGQRLARVARGLGVVAEVRLVRARRVDERVHGAAVLGGEDAVAGRGVGRDARAGQRLLQLRVDLREVGAHAGRLDGLARGQRDDRQQRDRLAAGARVALGDLDVGDRALLVGHGELLRERRRGRARGEDPADGRGDPEGDDDALVREDPTREGGHRPSLLPGRGPAYRECP